MSDRSPIGAIVVGVGVLIAGGAWLANATQGHMQSSAASVHYNREIESNDRMISDRAGRLHHLQGKITEDLEPRERQVDDIKKAMADLSRQHQELDALLTQTADLRGGINAVTEEGRAYRENYRTQIRAAARGEKVTLKTRSGKSFENATITEVSAEGMTLQHDSGLARLNPADLDGSWTARFQWGADEPGPQPATGVAAAAVPAPSGAPAPTKAAAPIRTPVAPPPPDPAAAQAAEEMAALRKKVEDLSLKITDTQAKLDSARMSASYSRSRSSTGSLTTWEEQINTLQTALTNLQYSYNTANASLSARIAQEAAARKAAREAARAARR